MQEKELLPNRQKQLTAALDWQTAGVQGCIRECYADAW